MTDQHPESGADRAIAPFVDARFTCARCGNEAGRVTLIPRGAVDPISPGPDIFAGSMSRIVIDAGRLSITIGRPKVDVDGLASALGAADPAALFAVNREYAPFWCPDCAAIYCAAEWRLWDVFDPEWPDWWEELRGACPNGHERWIFD